MSQWTRWFCRPCEASWQGDDDKCFACGEQGTLGHWDSAAQVHQYGIGESAMSNERPAGVTGGISDG